MFGVAVGCVGRVNVRFWCTVVLVCGLVDEGVEDIYCKLAFIFFHFIAFVEIFQISCIHGDEAFLCTYTKV